MSAKKNVISCLRSNLKETVIYFEVSRLREEDTEAVK
ncbi:hypothetical protein CLORY_15290 [Clostridium oryzae]|uniref:Uncharacterized protein n=1 Tax=Clostridium oryzae TaxID=1450648 RepID=A0A1V4ISX9_9CLOT|nr:hypothetical protein CLORY_15290 [Clostridium oryzae]